MSLAIDRQLSGRMSYGTMRTEEVLSFYFSFLVQPHIAGLMTERRARSRVRTKKKLAQHLFARCWVSRVGFVISGLRLFGYL